ncbi:MAG: PIN domain-containing protein [Candidatus Saccharibacteria bacterium]|nr:PIN domain-containing protein [Candidatus Saccharibacteria bacterium]
MKYLFIDTNIYITCCLMELEGDNLGTLKQLHKLLNLQKVKLLFPDVVFFELKKVLNEKTEKIKAEVGKVREFTKTNTSLNEKIRTDINKKMTECIDERITNSDRVKKEINSIYSSANTIKNELEIVDEDLVEAYKMYLSGVRPFKKGYGELQPDCLIISTLERFFKSKNGYQLLFCSANNSDFAERNDKSEYVIHKDIAEKFSNITYSENLFSLLNKEFNAKFPEKSIEEFDEKADELSVGMTDSDQKEPLAGDRAVIMSIYDRLNDIAAIVDPVSPMRTSLKQIVSQNPHVRMSDFIKDLDNIYSIRSQVKYQRLEPDPGIVKSYFESAARILELLKQPLNITSDSKSRETNSS